MKKTNLIVLGLTLVSAFVFFGCPKSDDALVTDDDADTEDAYVDDAKIEEEHEVGVTPCPQVLKVIPVGRTGGNGNLIAIDSAAFECPHNAIDVYFGDDRGVNYCTFGSTETEDLKVEFNCAQAADVTTNVECDFYKGDSLVDQATIPVELKVK